MARTRGGGVIGGASRPRRIVGKPRAPGEGQPSPRAPPPSSPRDKNAIADSLVARRGADRSAGERQRLTSLPEGGGQALLHRGGAQMMGGGRYFATGMATGGDGDDVLEDFFGLFDDTIGDEPIVKTTVVGRSRHDTSGRSTGSITHRKNRPAAVRKSPLSLPKTPVWRMLYIDPDVSDPKLVAGLLEKTASRALRCGCVFDVATDIVEALADVRGDTMWVYRGVFINESLYRHKKLDHTRSDMSIQGKHLSQFLRQVGMSGTRIVLLVAGDVHFDTADAGAHGLSAVLRKPFTKDGFCDILRGMYLSDEAAPVAPPTTGEPGGAQPKPAASSPGPPSEPRRSPSHLGLQESLAKGSIAPEGRPKVAGAIRPTGPAATTSAAAPMAMHSGAQVPPSAYPACLGFTPFPPSMINSYHLVSGLLRPGQNGPRRKYTKIAPKEEDEAAAVPAQTLRASSPDPPALATVVTTSVAANQAGHGVLPGSGNRTGVGLAASRDVRVTQDFPVASSPPKEAALGVDNPSVGISSSDTGVVGGRSPTAGADATMGRRLS